MKPTVSSLNSLAVEGTRECNAAGRSAFAAVTTAMALCAASTAYAGFGAIAFSSSDGGIGYSDNYPSKQSAEARALIECRQRGGNDCQIAIWERNACAVLAVGKDNGWGTAWHQNAVMAERRAIANCLSFSSECAAKAWIFN